MTPTADRSRAVAVAALAAFGASLAVALILLVLFEPDVQTMSAEELYARRDDARAFLVGDFVFILLYGVLSPIVLWRFWRASGSRWAAAGAVLLACAAVVDVAEGVLLMSATDGVSQGAVDAAHGLEIPKVGLFVAGLIPAVVANVQAARFLRAGHQTSPARGSQVSSPSTSTDAETGRT